MALGKERGGGGEERFLPLPLPPSFFFWFSFHFSRCPNRKSHSLVFLFSKTKRKRLLRRLEKIQSNLHLQPPLVSHSRTTSKRPPPVSDCGHVSGLTFQQFSFVFSLCKRPLDALSDLFIRCMYYATQSIRRTFSDNMEMHLLQAMKPLSMA